MVATRKLGRSGIEVSALGLGCWAIGGPCVNEHGHPIGWGDVEDGESVRAIHRALDMGITLFDTANVYGAGHSEHILALALAGRRQNVVIATKFGRVFDSEERRVIGNDASPQAIRTACEDSLRRLNTDYIDLYQYHTPDGVTPIAETLGALTELVEEGKVRYVGHSNFAGWQFGAAEVATVRSGGVRFVSAQNHFNLLDRRAELEVLPAAREFGLGVLPYFPLANGLLTGKYSPTSGDGRLRRVRPEVLENTDWDQLDAYRRICDDAGVTMLQATFAWLLAQDPVSSVIAGATTPEQVAANAEAGRTRLDQETLDAISRLFA